MKTIYTCRVVLHWIFTHQFSITALSNIHTTRQQQQQQQHFELSCSIRFLASLFHFVCSCRLAEHGLFTFVFHHLADVITMCNALNSMQSKTISFRLGFCLFFVSFFRSLGSGIRECCVQCKILYNALQLRFWRVLSIFFFSRNVDCS